MSGTQAPRNPDYNRALTIRVARLSMLNAVLVDALVDSRHTRTWACPRQTAGSSRRRSGSRWNQTRMPCDGVWGRAQAKITQAPDATKGGNSTKRIRLRVDAPGFLPGDADRLAQALATPAVVSFSHPGRCRSEAAFAALGGTRSVSWLPISTRSSRTSGPGRWTPARIPSSRRMRWC
jgi:hypothetical protein